VVEDGSLRVGDWLSPAPAGAVDGPVDVYFRPDEVEFAPAEGTGLAAQVLAISARGPDLRIDCRIEGQAFELVARDKAPPTGQARITPRRLTLFAR
jgi:sulfate transport system ATP-binding protein